MAVMPGKCLCGRVLANALLCAVNNMRIAQTTFAQVTQYFGRESPKPSRECVA